MLPTKFLPSKQASPMLSPTSWPVWTARDIA